MKLLNVSLFNSSDLYHQRINSYKEALTLAQMRTPKNLEEETLEKAADLFSFFYSDFSVQRIDSHLQKLYQDNAYFRDGVKELRGIEAISQYFKKVASQAESIQFNIQDRAYSEQNCYFRWLLNLQIKNEKPDSYVGMSHVIFDEDAKVIFQQDYLDLSELVEKFPVIGKTVSWIKSWI